MCVFFCAPYIVMMLYLLMPLNIFFFINIFFRSFFFGLYIMGGVVRWMIWKGSYKFSFIFLFVYNFVAFAYVCFEIWFLAWFSFDTKKEVGRKRELRNKFEGEFWRKKIWIAFGFWNLIRKYKNNPGCCLLSHFFLFFNHNYYRFSVFLNEKFLQFFFVVVVLHYYFSFISASRWLNIIAGRDQIGNEIVVIWRVFGQGRFGGISTWK